MAKIAAIGSMDLAFGFSHSTLAVQSQAGDDDQQKEQNSLNLSASVSSGVEELY